MSSVLDGIRVIDFGQFLAGPLLAMMLADVGADVIRVDPPNGPRWQHRANAILQRGKRSIVLDLREPEDQKIARQLIAGADIAIENFRPGVMDQLGLGPQAMTAANPQLIYCSIPGFASDDPRAGVPGYEGVVAAAAGLYLPSPWDPEGDPVFNPLPLSSSYATIISANSVMAALIARERTGRGQRIEVPLFDASFEAVGMRGDRYPDGREPQFDISGFARPNQPNALNGPYECADGRFLRLSWLERRQLIAFALKFGEDQWAVDGLLDETEVRSNPAVAASLRDKLTAVFKTRPAAEWARIANPESDMAECQTTAEWLRDEHARVSRSVISLTDPEYGPTLQAGYPVTLSKAPPQAQGPRHALDADRTAILAEVDAAPEVNAAEPANRVTLSSALEGMRVIDATQILGGPTAGRILAEFGADVIKINDPNGLPGGVGYNHYANSGKRSLLLNLKAPEGMAIFWRLIEGADVFSMNFLPPAAERLGVTEADVRKHRPDIVYSAMSSFGWEGPRGTHRGHEQLGQAVTGMEERWGRGGLPLVQRFLVCDFGTGNLTALAILLGLFHRLRTGEGQFVGASLSQTGTFHQMPFMIDYDGRVWDEPAGQQATGYGPLHRLYKASDAWFFLGARNPEDLARLEAVNGLQGLSAADGSALEAALSGRFATQPANVWVQRLNAAGLGAHALRRILDNMEDRWVKAHHLSIEREHPDIGPVRTVGPSARLSLTPVQVTRPARWPGSESREILTELGLGDRVDELVAAGVVSEWFPETPPPPSTPPPVKRAAAI